MDTKQIQEILRMVNRSSLTEVEIEQKDFKLRIRKKPGEDNIIYSSVPVQQAVPAVTPAVVQAAAPAEAVAKETPAKPKEDKKEDEENGNLIPFKSPMIGTFYRASSPDKDPFVKVGDSISKGNVLCIIEAMKLFNEIEYEGVEGKIVKILVENAQPVEYDQPLFLIDPS